MVFLEPHRAIIRSRGSAIRIEFLGANERAVGCGRNGQSANTHYLTGNTRQEWRTQVPTFARVEFKAVYPGVDVVYYSRGGELEYDLVLAPGADPGIIRLAFHGASEMRLDQSGDLILRLPGGELRHRKPRAYQRGVRRLVEARYVLKANEVGIELGAYDRSKTLIIDPALSYATYLGGGGADAITSVAIDSAGYVYLTGWTESTDFPSLGNGQAQNSGGVDVFVVKLSPGGNSLLYATYIGGRGDDRGLAIGVDDSGSALITGWTYSADFPTVSPFQPRLAGGRDAFVAKLNPSGNSLAWSTYLGGGGHDSGNGIAVDKAGSVYVAGDTQSMNFPLLNAFRQSNAGRQDGFVAKLDSGGALRYSTYIGGYGDEHCAAVAVDAAGAAYIAGSTDSVNFPTASALQSHNSGGQDAFVLKLNAMGNGLVYSTYLGGSRGSPDAPEGGAAVAVDSAGYAYVAGTTSSTNFPTVRPLRSSLAGGRVDAFVSKLDPSGRVLAYSTYLGGTGLDLSTAIAVDETGKVSVAGYTTSTDFPCSNPLQRSNRGVYDAFIATLAPGGDALVFGTFLGGSGADAAYGMARDGRGNLYVVGLTLSQDFPWLAALQSVNRGADGFVAMIQPGTCTYVVNPAGPLTMPSWGGAETVVVSTQPGCGWVASRDADWLTITSGAAGSGNGAIGFSVAPNAGATPRSVRLTVGDQSVTITQRASLVHNEVFVRQLYLDFLNREADTGSLTAWLDGLARGYYTRAQVAESFFNHPDFNLHAIYVVKLYLGVLLRAPDYGGWKAWVDCLRSGVPQTLVLDYFLSSPEYQARFGYLAQQPDSDFVTFLYRNLLGREPDPAGLTGWTEGLASGQLTRRDVINGFISSSEFGRRVQTAVLAHLLYAGFLRRVAEPDWVAYWAAFLGTRPLSEAIQAFISSPEYLGRL